MNVYKRMYLLLFNAVTDAIALLPERHPVRVSLMKAQQACEEIYMDDGE